jgi:hypothetical protein
VEVVAVVLRAVVVRRWLTKTILVSPPELHTPLLLEMVEKRAAIILLVVLAAPPIFLVPLWWLLEVVGADQLLALMSTPMRGK